MPIKTRFSKRGCFGPSIAKLKVTVERFYFDHNATTPVCNEVLEVVIPAMLEVYGNASSIHHQGQAAKQKLDAGRREVAELLRCHPTEVVFVSGGTEANNLAIFGTVRRVGAPGKHIITTTIEHPAVLSACAQLEREGASVTYVAVGPSGVVDPNDIQRALLPQTVLITVMHANNELGTVQPVEAIGDIARQAGVVFHSDGVQAAGKLPISVNEFGVDLYSLSGHKIYAPKGVGALYVRKGVELHPILFGGHHERDRRPGTENVPGAVAMGRAAMLIRERLRAEAERLTALRDRLEQGVQAQVGEAYVNCGNSPRVPNTSSIRFDGIQGEPLLIALDMKGFAVSSGSACSSGTVEPSHVLTAIGMERNEARACLRFSLGRSNDAAQVDALVSAVASSVAHLRRLAPSHV
jgi:cysteine desulfurase